MSLTSTSRLGSAPGAVDAVTLLLLQPAAGSSFPVPPGLVPPSAFGLRLYSAYLLAAPFNYASRPVVFEFGP